jgi:hypothetical protein
MTNMRNQLNIAMSGQKGFAFFAVPSLINAAAEIAARLRRALSI